MVSNIPSRRRFSPYLSQLDTEKGSMRLLTFSFQIAGASLSLLFVADAIAAKGDLVLRQTMLGSPITLTTRAKFGGAVSSLVFRGKEHLDSLDHGRLLQSASSFDGYGECFNPTEGGEASDSGNENVSVVRMAKVGYRSLHTVADMGFWLSPGQAYPQGCGTRKNVVKAVNTTPTSGHILEKTITLGMPGFPNVINHSVTFYPPASFSSATFEASTGYVPKEFSRALYYDVVNDVEIDPKDRQGEQSFPVVLSTQDDAYAIGVFSPQLPQEGIGYGRFTFPDVNKWNCVFRELNVQPKPYRYVCMIVLGTRQEVKGTLRRLTVKYKK